MVLRNELLAGWGAAVKKLTSEGWPPSTFGCDTPLNTVKSFLCSFSVSRYGDAAYSRPAPVGKKLPGRRPRLLQMANIRRGVALGASGEETSADCTNGTTIESKNGSAIATPTPRRKWRREIDCRVKT